MREKRVTTPDGHAWYVRRRWARRQPPWKRQADHELSPVERDTVPILTDTDDLLGPVLESFTLDAEVGLFVVLALLAVIALGALALVGVVREWVVPFLVANLGWIDVALATIAVLVFLDRLTRPWLIEAESARLFHSHAASGASTGGGAADGPFERSSPRSPRAVSTTSVASFSSLAINDDHRRHAGGAWSAPAPA